MDEEVELEDFDSLTEEIVFPRDPELPEPVEIDLRPEDCDSAALFT